MENNPSWFQATAEPATPQIPSSYGKLTLALPTALQLLELHTAVVGEKSSSNFLDRLT